MPVLQRIMRLLEVHVSERKATFLVKSSAAVSRVKASADGRGVVSHAGMGLLRELADQTGFVYAVHGRVG